MMQLFKKRDEDYIYSEYYLKVQKLWSVKMSRLTAGLSKKKLIVLLFAFVVLSAGYLIYNICRSVFAERFPAKYRPEVSKVLPINQKKMNYGNKNFIDKRSKKKKNAFGSAFNNTSIHNTTVLRSGRRQNGSGSIFKRT